MSVSLHLPLLGLIGSAFERHHLPNESKHSAVQIKSTKGTRLSRVINCATALDPVTFTYNSLQVWV